MKFFNCILALACTILLPITTNGMEIDSSEEIEVPKDYGHQNPRLHYQGRTSEINNQWISGPSKKMYQFNNGQQSWLTARETCLAQNADLVTIDGGSVELEWLLSHYKPEFPNMRERQIQIGLMLETKSGEKKGQQASQQSYREWHWVNGKAMDENILQWAHGEPFDHSHQGKERCALLNVKAHQLVDVDCDLDAEMDHSFRFICERSHEKHLEHESLNNPLWRKLEDILTFFGISSSDSEAANNGTVIGRPGEKEEGYWDHQNTTQNLNVTVSESTIEIIKNTLGNISKNEPENSKASENSNSENPEEKLVSQSKSVSDQRAAKIEPEEIKEVESNEVNSKDKKEAQADVQSPELTSVNSRKNFEIAQAKSLFHEEKFKPKIDFENDSEGNQTDDRIVTKQNDQNNRITETEKIHIETKATNGLNDDITQKILSGISESANASNDLILSNKSDTNVQINKATENLSSGEHAGKASEEWTVPNGSGPIQDANSVNLKTNNGNDTISEEGKNSDDSDMLDKPSGGDKGDKQQEYPDSLGVLAETLERTINSDSNQNTGEKNSMDKKSPLIQDRIHNLERIISAVQKMISASNDLKSPISSQPNGRDPGQKKNDALDEIIAPIHEVQAPTMNSPKLRRRLFAPTTHWKSAVDTFDTENSLLKTLFTPFRAVIHAAKTELGSPIVETKHKNREELDIKQRNEQKMDEQLALPEVLPEVKSYYDKFPKPEVDHRREDEKRPHHHNVDQHRYHHHIGPAGPMDEDLKIFGKLGNVYNDLFKFAVNEFQSDYNE